MRPRKSDPTAAGKLILDAIEKSGMKQITVAGHLRRSRQAFSQVIQGKMPLTAYWALRIEKILGVDAVTLATVDVKERIEKIRAKRNKS